jgi:hypothetical protein
VAPTGVGATLAMFERALVAGRVRQEELPAWYDWLFEVFDSEDYGSPNHGRAYRLMDEVGGMLPEDGGRQA